MIFPLFLWIAPLAVKAFGVALFTLKTRARLKAEEMAEIFVRAFPKIVQFLKRNSPPFIAKVTVEGKVLMEVDLKYISPS